MTRHAVPLDEVVFDTLDGDAVTLATLVARDDTATTDRLVDAVERLDAPDHETVGAADGWLGDDDLVVSFVDDAGGAWASRVGILNLHEIVNDEVAGRPALVSYCPLCASAVVYDRVVDGGNRSFSDTSALHDNDLAMVDRERGSFWWQVAGGGISSAPTQRPAIPWPLA